MSISRWVDLDDWKLENQTIKGHLKTLAFVEQVL